jgi:hypothetical protein
MIVVSCSLAAVGILVCAAGLLDTLMPKASVFWFMIRMAALAAAIALIVSGYVWVCDKCEDYLSGRLDRLLNMRRGVRRQDSVKGEKDAGVPPKVGHRSDTRRFPQADVPADHNGDGLGGFAKPTGDSSRTVATKKR